MNVSMTATALAKQYVANWNRKMQNANGSEPAAGHVNPYEDPWMDITNRSLWNGRESFLLMRMWPIKSEAW